MEQQFTIRNISDVEAIEKIPLSKRLKVKNTYELLEKGAAINLDAIAISFLFDGDNFDKSVDVTYRQFIGKIRQTANMLHDLGTGVNDTVTYLLPNIPQTHYALWGAEAVGIANPVNPMLEPAAIRDICIAANTKVLIALGEFPGTDIWEKVEKIRNEIPSLTHVVKVMGKTDEAQKIIGFEEKIEQYPDDRLTFDRNINPDDIASMYHTGGTTGRPKLALRTHYNEVTVTWDISAVAGIKRAEAVMVGLPLFHCNGTIVTGLFPFSIGARVIMLSPMGYRTPSIMQNFYKIVEHYKPVFFSSVPTVLSVLSDIPVDGADISSLRYLICGAAPLSVELFKRFEKHTNMRILEGYGLTEVGVASSANPKDGERKVGSIGIRMPYQEMKIAILDEKCNYMRDAYTDEIGSLCIKGPCVFKGYVEEIHNRGIWLSDGWFNTGDMGREDKDGFFWLTGRQKDLIIRGGHNIDPAIIEEALYKLEGVNTAAAVGRPDSHAGEVPVAYVTLKKNSKLSEDEIMAWARENISEQAAIPRDIIITDEIPLTEIGKVFKPALRNDVAKKLFESELSIMEDLTSELVVDIEEDKRHGTCAMIYLTPSSGVDSASIKEQIDGILAGYAIYYEVMIREEDMD
ncbi:acyl-CoA synthetase [Desulfobacterales bacterium HSG16]|nr:acyl-CoA synthetase [Desulfobacterales bacterium HSG16]